MAPTLIKATLMMASNRLLVVKPVHADTASPWTTPRRMQQHRKDNRTQWRRDRNPG
jgi:hypothetical protein